MADSYMSYLPPLYHDIAEFEEIAKTVDAEIALLEAEVHQIFNNRFVMTANEYGVKRREKAFKIQADPSTENLDFRKKRIINRQSTKAPFTSRFLQNRLDYLVGAGRVVMSVDWLNSILAITAGIKDAPLFKEVEHTIRTIKPASMVYQQETALSDSITLEERISLRRLYRMTRLSTTWKLGRTPFAEASEEVRIK